MGCLQSKGKSDIVSPNVNEQKSVEIVSSEMPMNEEESVIHHDTEYDSDDEYISRKYMKEAKIRFDDDFVDSDDEYTTDKNGNSVILVSNINENHFGAANTSNTLDNSENIVVNPLGAFQNAIIDGKQSVEMAETVAVTDEIRDSRATNTFTTDIEFAGETLKLLQSQLKSKGIVPLEFIPLSQIKAEMASLMEAANKGEPFDDSRLDYLLSCMELNPEYQREKEAEAKKWRDEITPYTAECLSIMRSYIPPSIFSCSVDSLVTDFQFSRELAKRLFTKKCLWLIRIAKHDIERIHEAELCGRFNPMSQGLDIIETTAIYASLPAKFVKDSTGRKEAWRLNIEKNMKDMYKQLKGGSLLKIKQRSPAYLNQLPQFTQRETLHEMRSVSSDPMAPRNSFLSITKASRAAGAEEAEELSNINSDRAAAAALSNGTKSDKSTNAVKTNSLQNESVNGGKENSAPTEGTPAVPRKTDKHAAFSATLNNLFAAKGDGSANKALLKKSKRSSNASKSPATDGDVENNAALQ